MKVVPEAYGGNSQPTLPKNIAKVHNYLKQFASMCGFTLGQDNLRSLTAEVIALHRKKGVKNRKGYEENCAVAIFQGYKDEHKMTIREFCRRSGVRESKFN